MKHTLPPLKKSKKKTGEPVEAYDDEWSRRIHIPASKEMIAALEIGASVDVSLKGEVKSLESRENDNAAKYEICLLINEVKLDVANEFTELAEEEDED